jgi:DNA helicase-2/ATP-dependent DNA helicase PcrA
MSVNRLPPVGRIRQSTEAGYYCFDEMFVWASELLDRFPDVIETIRGRCRTFPHC